MSIKNYVLLEERPEKLQNLKILTHYTRAPTTPVHPRKYVTHAI